MRRLFTAVAVTSAVLCALLGGLAADVFPIETTSPPGMGISAWLTWSETITATRTSPETMAFTSTAGVLTRDGFGRIEQTRHVGAYAHCTVVTGRTLWRVPLWPFVAATGLPPAAWLCVYRRRWLEAMRGMMPRARRARRGLCPECGHDLRATPRAGGPLLARCPECGAAAG